jgi:two-component system response regulator HydG
MAGLRFFRGDEALFTHRTMGNRVVIGRGDTCDVALPGADISRVHCQIFLRDGQWWLTDLSRHGTDVDREKVEGELPITDRSQIRLGPYRIQLFTAEQDAEVTGPLCNDRGFEQVQGQDNGNLRVQVAAIRVLGADPDGRPLLLRKPRVSVGGIGSALVVGRSGLLANHCWLRVALGRVMLEPGQGAAWIDEERVREITPLYPGEVFRIGPTHIKVERIEDRQTPAAEKFGQMVGKSPAMRQVMGALHRMAGHHFTVLIAGESGTGKELVSRGLHELSPRASGPFVAINCAAVSVTLFESALFGHEKGAFTGADTRKDGAFQSAHGGTLFLDEVGELPEETQAKLLRALETGEVRRVGSNEVTFPDVRVVAATNRDLQERCRQGKFREDLYFRLSVLSIELPPLRDRKEDIGLLSRRLLEQIDPDAVLEVNALDKLRSWHWPGNVRELRNVLTRAYVQDGRVITANSVSFQKTGVEEPPGEKTPSVSERDELVSMLDRYGANRSAIARELGVARSTVLARLHKYGLA